MSLQDRNKRKTEDRYCKKCRKKIRVKKENLDAGPHFCGDCKREIKKLESQRARAERGRSKVSGASGYIQKSRAVSESAPKTQYSTILNVSIYDQQTCYSIDMRGMPHLFKQRLRLVRDRIFWKSI
ncbi:MAG: hypothetical protein ACW97G_11935 [Candidatus Thorarchaeota archaeon]|jgi:hypothetical protein